MANKYQLRLKGYVGGWNFDADYVDYVLNKNQEEEVNVLINSLGGEVSTAFSVSAAFKRHGNVHVHYEGMNASAATIASLGAKKVSIDCNAMYLVHKCCQEVFKWDMLNADQLEQLIAECEKAKKDLEKIDLNIASAYAARCKKDTAELLQLMKEGGWLNANEALEWGFVDEVTDLPEAEKPKMTEDVVNFMASEGIPMPDLPEGTETRSMMQRLVEAIQGIFHKEQQKMTDKMKKNFMNVCQALKCEFLDIEQEKVDITDEQMQRIEDKMESDSATITDLTQKVDARDQEIAELKEQIDSLQQQPAGDTGQVIDNGQREENDEYFNVINDAQNMYKQIP